MLFFINCLQLGIMESEEIRSVHGTYNGLYIEYSMELSSVLAGDSYTQSTCSLKTRSISVITVNK